MKMVNFGFLIFLALLEPVSTCLDGKLLSYRHISHILLNEASNNLSAMQKKENNKNKAKLN